MKMKVLRFFLLSSLTTCCLATSGQTTISCYECVSTPQDAYCTDTDLGELKTGCKTCFTHEVGKNKYKRECSMDYQEDACGVMSDKKQLCVCNTDLCNAEIRFKPLVKCHVCESQGDHDPRCTDLDLGPVEESCSTCATYKLAEKRFKRECSHVRLESKCQFKDKQQVCTCNTGLCNAQVVFKPLIKCYVCDASQKGPGSKCNQFHLGAEVDGCSSCSSLKLGEDSFIRNCELTFQEDHCGLIDLIQMCVCNKDLCNGNNIFQRVIKCHKCEGAIDDTTACTDGEFGEEIDNCLSCSSIKIKENVFRRGCEAKHQYIGCFLEVANTCYCDTELCNKEDVRISIIKCYECEGTSLTDTSCKVRNSGRVKLGCYTCRTSVKNGMRKRKCLDYAEAPSSETINGKTITQCNKDLCNGEGEDGVYEEPTGDPTSRGLQKTVSSRVLIGGVLLAMLGLARFF